MRKDQVDENKTFDENMRDLQKKGIIDIGGYGGKIMDIYIKSTSISKKTSEEFLKLFKIQNMK